MVFYNDNTEFNERMIVDCYKTYVVVVVVV